MKDWCRLTPASSRFVRQSTTSAPDRPRHLYHLVPIRARHKSRPVPRSFNLWPAHDQPLCASRIESSVCTGTVSPLLKLINEKGTTSRKCLIMVLAQCLTHWCLCAVSSSCSTVSVSRVGMKRPPLAISVLTFELVVSACAVRPPSLLGGGGGLLGAGGGSGGWGHA